MNINKNKYLKYKDKYSKLKLSLLNQSGGGITTGIPNSLPTTQSWLYMPIILAPFDNIRVIFDPDIDIKLKENNLPTIDSCIDKLKKFYISKNVDLSDFNNLKNYFYTFDSQLHMIIEDQTRLLKYADIQNILYNILYAICNSTRWVNGHFENINLNLVGKQIYLGLFYDVYTDPATNVSFISRIYNNEFKGGTTKVNIASIANLDVTTNKTTISQYLMDRDINIVIRNPIDPSYTNKTQALLIFGSFNDKFGALYTYMKNYNGYIIYFIDKENFWYSKLMSPYILAIKEFANSINDYIFFGGSMGGYAALHASVFFPSKRKICIAITPQTINYTYFNDKIFVNRNRDTVRPIINSTEYIYKNITDVLSENNGYNTKIYTLIGKSECDDLNNFNMDLFIDSLHTGAIINFPNVNTIIFNYATHILIIKINLITLIKILENNFDTLFNNQKAGSILLKDGIDNRS